MVRQFSVLGSCLVAVLGLAFPAQAEEPLAVKKVLSNPAQASLDDLARAVEELKRKEIENQNDLRNASPVVTTVPDTAGLVTTAHVRQGSVAVSLIAEQPTPASAPGGVGPESQTLASYKLSYQAGLTDNLGNALPGPAVNLTFRIYSALVGGVLVEGPINVLGVAIDNGLVSTTFPVSLNTFDGSDRYITVAVNGGAEMTPRYQITAVAYALFAQRIASNQVLGSATDSGSIMIQNGAMAQPSIALTGTASQISTFGSDGLEQFRVWGSLWFELLGNDEVGNNTTVFLSAQSNSGGLMQLRDADGATRLQMMGQGAGTGGELSLYDDDGTETVEIVGAEDSLTGASVQLRNAAGTTMIDADAEFGAAGSKARFSVTGTTVTEILQITGGADIAEPFDVSGGDIQPGMVVCIDHKNPGKLVLSRKAFDTRVAGIVSGAGGINTGMLMGQKKTAEGETAIADGKYPIALTGRVYCMVDATSDAVEPGDALTTSDTPGHAMKAFRTEAARFSIIGKAMSGLERGKKGLVLVLVNLQ